MTETWILIAAAAAVAAALAVVALVLPGRAAAVRALLADRQEGFERRQERIEAAVRDEMAKGRAESGAGARELREEVRAALEGFAGNMARLAESNESRIEKMRQTVEGSLRALENPKTYDYLKDLSKDPRIRVLDYNQPFNYSRINHIAVREAKGSIIAFLNNDIEVISRDWLREMVSHAIRPEIGAVGARLYYPDDTVQLRVSFLDLRGGQDTFTVIHLGTGWAIGRAESWFRTFRL